MVILAMTLCAPVLMAATTELGTFSCPSGQVEDLQCAAYCCEQYSGTYILETQTCDVLRSADWNSVVSCERQYNCCKPVVPVSDPVSNGSSCCGPAVLLLFIGVGAVMRRG